MGFLSKLKSLGKKLGKSVANNVGGALAQTAGKALGKGVNAVSSSFMSRISGQVPPIGNFPGKALAPLSSAAIKLPGAAAFQAVRKTPYGTNKFASPIPTLPKFGP